MASRMASWADDLKYLQENKGVDSLIHVRPPTDKEIRLSPEVEEYLEELGESTEELLQKPVVLLPPVDDSHPLAHYFISSSHNTYLLSRQILGRSSALAYTHVLWRHARCVELDIWPSSDGKDLIVTHGYTLSSSVPLREVCEAIGAAIRPGDWPIFASLECHVAPEKQGTLVNTLREMWGEKLVDSEVVAPGADITPSVLKGRIVCMVEYYPEQNPLPGSPSLSASSSSSDFDSSLSETETVQALDDTAQNTANKVPARITDALAKLGLYARSLKPGKGWFDQASTEPRYTIINISESGLKSLLLTHTAALISHAASHLRRVYPRGTRVASSNLNPLHFWRTGSHITALNWQKYDRGTQMNEAMFAGTPGFVLKPSKLLPGGAAELLLRKRMRLEVIALSSLLVPEDVAHIGAYFRVQVYHSGDRLEFRSKTMKCPDARARNHCADFKWDETCEFEYEDDGLVFLRIVVMQNVPFGRDTHQAIFVARTEYLQDGLYAVRLLTPKGKDSGATLLVRFTFEDVA